MMNGRIACKTNVTAPGVPMSMTKFRFHGLNDGVYMDLINSRLSVADPSSHIPDLRSLRAEK